MAKTIMLAAAALRGRKYSVINEEISEIVREIINENTSRRRQNSY